MLTTIREEQLLAKFAGEDVAVPQPCTRTEKFLAKMAGLDVQTPTPITREEQILNKIAEGGGGGGDFSTAEVKIINNTGNHISDQFPQCIEKDELGEGSPAAITTTDGFNLGETTIKIPLYKGHALLLRTTETPIDVTGDIVTIADSMIDVSGNGTITFKPLQ